MDPRLLDYYSQELQYIREMGAEFAQEYPKIAARLALSGLECADPYVERLLEGFAFLREALLSFLMRRKISFGASAVHLALCVDFSLRDFGGVDGIEFGDLGFLFAGQFHGGRRFRQPLHRQFVCALHVAAST